MIPKHRTRERGAILVLVIWITTLLALMIASFATAVQSDSRAVIARRDLDRADALAEAGIARAALGLLDESEFGWLADGRAYVFTFDGVEMTLRLLDENGRLDLNLATRGMLEALIESRGLPRSESAPLVSAILDWRDSDDAREALGAEDPQYAGAGLPQGAGDRPFLHLSELSLVFGMTPELYRDLAPFLTVQGSASGINPLTAPLETLSVFTPLEEAILPLLLRLREEPLPDGTAVSAMLGGGGDLLTFDEGPVYSIQVSFALPSGLRAWREAVIWLNPSEEQAYRVLEWRKPIAYTAVADRVESDEEDAGES